MIVRHLKSQLDPKGCSAKAKVWVYRTEVENTLDRPVRVIWLDFSYQDDCHGSWFTTNIRNRTLRNDDFVEWYGDGNEKLEGGWLKPGQIASCDPNYHFAFGEELTPVKWSFIAVDAEGNDYFAEAIVPEEAVAIFEPVVDD